MGLFKFLKKMFKGTALSPPEEAEQSATPVECEPEKLSGAPKKRTKRKFSQITWQMCGNKPAAETDLVIGFDLGTSCTKVIIQDGVLKKAYAVSFNGRGCKGNPYLLPTSIAVNQDGIFSIDKNGFLIDALKLRFLQQPDRLQEYYENVSITAVEALCAYIGLVLMEVREWFWNEKSSDYENVRIDWQLNMGMSSRSYDDHALNTLMKRVALAAWNLTLNNKDSIDVRDIRSAIAAADHQISEGIIDEDSQQLHPDNVCPVPEIIAQVVGYARSPMRQNGMYLILDVGASTIDVSNFIIHEDEGEDLYTILVAEVEKLGASVLHNYRISCAETVIRKYLGDAKGETFKQNMQKIANQSFDGVAPPPEIESHLPVLPEEAISALRKVNEEFMVQCSIIVRKVIKESMFRRNPHSLAWQIGLPVFLCGGGSQIDTYQNIIPYAEKQLSSTSFSGFEIRQLPKPINLETRDIPPRDYHRMSVAYGLSFSSFDIGKILPPGSVPDLLNEKRIRDISGYFIDKDMV